MTEHILGIDMNDISTSACLLRDGRLIAAAQEERFNREKRTRRFPVKAMDWCLKSNGLELEDVVAAAVSVNPAVYLENLNVAHSGRARFRGELLYAAPNFLLGVYDGLAARTSVLKIETDGGGQLDVYYIRHHDAHAASAFFMSAFEESAVFTADAFGEKDTTVFFKASGAGIERLRSFEFPYSLGCFYAAVTEFLGFRPFADEWKVMGAAACGDPTRFSDAFSGLIDFEPETGLRMDLDFFNHYQFHRPKLYSGKLTALLGSPYGDDKEFDARFFDIAAAAQNAVERVVFKMLGYLHGITGTKNLCLSGGVAMNCVMNGKIHEQTPFEQIYVPPAPDDSGTSVGAALMTSRILDQRLSDAPVIRCDFGPEFSDSEIEAVLKTAGLKYEKTPSPARAAAEMIARNRIVAWVSGWNGIRGAGAGQQEHPR